MGAVIGVDVGTQSVKGVLLDAAGRVRAAAGAPLVISHPEPCCFALRDVTDRFDALGPAVGEIRVVGGGARSRGWMQTKADVTGRPVRAVQETEAVEHSVTPASEPFLPTAAHDGLHAQAYQEYRALFDGVDGALP